MNRPYNQTFIALQHIIHNMKSRKPFSRKLETASQPVLGSKTGGILPNPVTLGYRTGKD